MNRRLVVGIGFVSVLTSSVASAQEVTIGYQGLPYKASGEAPTGVQLSDAALLHVGIGAEAGYDTNVFYENVDTQSAAIIRVVPYAELTNASRTGGPRQLSFDARASLLYRRYQSDDPQVKRFENAWMPAAGLSLGLGGGQIGFGFADAFARIEEAPYSPTSLNPITRYNNQASLEGRWSPGGGRLMALLRYTNMVDIFADDYQYANSLTHSLMLDGSWKWLPKTALFANVQQSYVTYINDATTKPDLFPLRIAAGLRGLLTEKTSAILSVGYNNAFLSSGESTGGFWGSTFVELAATIRPTMLSRVVAGYRHDFTTAVISSFTYNETVYLSYVQQIAGRLALDISGRYVHRDYGGVFVDPSQAGRVDNFFQVGATLDYFLRNWTYVGVAYSMLSNTADNLPPTQSADYLKQQMFVRLGVTY